MIVKNHLCRQFTVSSAINDVHVDLFFIFVKFEKLHEWHADKEFVILRSNRKQELPYSTIDKKDVDNIT